MTLQPEDEVREGDIIVFDDGLWDFVCSTMIGLPVEAFLGQGIKEIVRNQCYLSDY